MSSAGPRIPPPVTPEHRQGRVSLERLSLNALRVGVIGVVGYGLLLVWSRLQFILLPFFVAVLLAALVMPVAAFLHAKLRLPRVFAAIVTVLLLIAIVTGLVTVVAPDIVKQAEDIGNQVEEGIRQLPDVLHDLGVKDEDIQRYSKDLTDKLQDSLGAIGGQLGTGVISAAQGVVNVAASVFLAVMMLIYLLIDGTGFWRGFLRFAPAESRVSWHDGGRRAWTAITQFVRSQVVVAVIDGVGIAIGLSILGIPLAIPLGILTFVLAFIPYVGAIVAGLAAMLVALSTNGIEGAVGAFVVALVVQQIEGNVLYPLLIGRSVRLHPLTVLLGVGAGSALLGIVGAFLATPVIAGVAAAAGWLEDDEELDGPEPEEIAPPEADPLGSPPAPDAEDGDARKFPTSGGGQDDD
ncbi:AI-2E family transporter [Patulibacter sp.]|uniref:AI-2E family transporter n=1 Tax=Patulibacter sp. TaxID=1912859 RepID=UPI0027192013|nr:AI-2E family transporter [Patulibacter sp.]MDO9409899.1 AI-2E family transporter [Patulibacter sp.]